MKCDESRKNADRHHTGEEGCATGSGEEFSLNFQSHQMKTELMWAEFCLLPVSQMIDWESR